jgi:hypothetical protein
MKKAVAVTWRFSLTFVILVALFVIHVIEVAFIWLCERSLMTAKISSS